MGKYNLKREKYNVILKRRCNLPRGRCTWKLSYMRKYNKINRCQWSLNCFSYVGPRPKDHSTYLHTGWYCMQVAGKPEFLHLWIADTHLTESAREYFKHRGVGNKVIINMYKYFLYNLITISSPFLRSPLENEKRESFPKNVLVFECFCSSYSLQFLFH